MDVCRYLRLLWRQFISALAASLPLEVSLRITEIFLCSFLTFNFYFLFFIFNLNSFIFNYGEFFRRNSLERSLRTVWEILSAQQSFRFEFILESFSVIQDYEWNLKTKYRNIFGRWIKFVSENFIQGILKCFQLASKLSDLQLWFDYDVLPQFTLQIMIFVGSPDTNPTYFWAIFLAGLCLGTGRIWNTSDTYFNVSSSACNEYRLSSLKVFESRKITD